MKTCNCKYFYSPWIVKLRFLSNWFAIHRKGIRFFYWIFISTATRKESTAGNLYTHNEEEGVGKLNPHRAYCEQKREKEGKTAKLLPDEFVWMDGG